MLQCPKCGSTNINVVMDTAQKIKKRGLGRKIARGFMIFFTAGLWKFVPARVGHTKTKPVALCQSCGRKFKA